VSAERKEFIVIRALTDSDLGLFSAQRARIRSKQRAININAAIAAKMLGPTLFAGGGGQFECVCVYQGRIVRDERSLRKSHKNWRLGGVQIQGSEFQHLRSGDFALIRCNPTADGPGPLAMSFVSQAGEQVAHCGLAAVIGGKLQDGMVVIEEGSEEFADTVSLCPREFIAVRSLAESDLGIFAALREQTCCKQRAFNINAKLARRMLSPTLYEGGGGEFMCTCRFKSRDAGANRLLSKVHKNWRLGGPKFEGREFGQLGCKDFLLIRSVEWNDGSHPLALTLVGKKTHRIVHAGIASRLPLRHSMTMLTPGDPLFRQLEKYITVSPAKKVP
jgi:hypothetical protein